MNSRDTIRANQKNTLPEQDDMLMALELEYACSSCEMAEIKKIKLMCSNNSKMTDVRLLFLALYTTQVTGIMGKSLD